MSLPGSTDQQKLDALGSKTYKEQAIWFLNGFWHRLGQAEAEKVWEYAHRLASLDAKGLQGNAVDEFNAHRFLELNNETQTVIQMREHFRSVGIEKVKLVPLCQFLVFRYKVDWHELVHAAQGDNQEEVRQAQHMLEQVQSAFVEVTRSKDEATAREADARSSEAEAKAKEAEAKQAQQELEAALAELKAQEDAYNQKTSDLTRKSEDASIGLVTRNKAKAELAQHLASDPLPLRKAKIDQEAAVRKAEKATAAAEKAAAEALSAREAAEAALVQAQQKLAEAQAYLDEVKSKPGSAAGALWWIDRELHEAKAYMPTSKGGYKKATKI